MNLQETVNYQLKIFGATWHPVLDMLKVDASMLHAGELTQYSKVSIAKNLLLCFDAEYMPSCTLRKALYKTSAFAADIAELKRGGHFPHDYFYGRMQMLHWFNDGVSWLRSAGICCTYQEKDCFDYTVKLFSIGKDIIRLLKLEKEFCNAADFLTAAGASKYMSETEEQLNCVLVGHEEWTEAAWLKQQLQWLHAVEALRKNGGLGTRLTKMFVQLQLVKSWIKLINEPS